MPLFNVLYSIQNYFFVSLGNCFFFYINILLLVILFFLPAVYYLAEVDGVRDYSLKFLLGVVAYEGF